MMPPPIPRALLRNAAKLVLADDDASNRASPPMRAHRMNGTQGGAPIKLLALTCAANVKMENVRWLWPGFIPFGKVTALESMMGVGKTQTALALCAAVTTGRSLPGCGTTPTGAAIIISLEDGHADTTVPRLTAAGADLSRCHLFEGYDFGGEHTDGTFNLAEDCQRLRLAIERTAATIVIIDPITATFGLTVNSYKDQDVRSVLAPLARVAEDTGAAVLFVRHFRKGGGSAEDAGGGSVGIGAACRSVLRVDRDPEVADRFLLSSVKSSVSRKPTTVAYRIESVALPGPIETSRIVWDGESHWTAATLAAQAMGTEERPRAEEAQDWLRDAISNGPKQAKELFRAADSEGIPRRTLQRAADVLGVEKKRKGFSEGSTWALPASIRAKEPPFVPSKSTARMGTNGTNGAVDVLL